MDPDWLLKVFHQSVVGVLRGNTASKMEYSIWKSNENWAEKWCQIVCSILFDLYYCMTSSGLAAKASQSQVFFKIFKIAQNWQILLAVKYPHYGLFFEKVAN